MPAFQRKVAESSAREGRESRLAALLEVLLAFVAMHVTFRALKSFTAYGRWEVEAGLNFLPGAVMIVSTLVILFACRRKLSDYALSLSHWEEDLKVGLFWTLLFAIAGTARLLVLGVFSRLSGLAPPDLMLGLLGWLTSFAALFLFGWLQPRILPRLRRVSTTASVISLAGLLFSPLPVAVAFEHPVVPVLLTTLWKAAFAAVGEEMFFGGYVQSRLNHAFGRPWRILGVRLGPGWLFTAALFGLLHALNSVDYFQGKYTFAWGYGVLAAGLLGGYIRESRGRIWTNVVIHALILTLGEAAALAAGI